jgi:hypothetical protein
VQSKKGARISASRLTNYISENEEGGLEAVGRGAGGVGRSLRRRAARFYLQFCEVGGPVIIHNRTWPNLARDQKGKYNCF